MRLAARWRELGLAGLMLLTACASGDRPTPTDPRAALMEPQSVSPSDAGIILQEAFEDNAFASRGWYDNTGIATTTAQHVAGSTRALEAHFPLGATTPTWGGAVRHLFPATPTLYVSYWVKYSTNWVGSGRDYQPHEFQILSDLDGDWVGPSDTYLTTYIEHNYRNGGIPRLSLQDSKSINTAATLFRTGGGTIRGTDLVANTEMRSIGGANGGVEDGLYWENFVFGTSVGYYNDKWLTDSLVRFQPSAGPGYKNQWNHVEVYLAMNSVGGGVGRHDGVMQYWFNGVIALDRHDILFHTGAHPDLRFHQFLIAPYISDGSPADQYMWVDDLTLATGKLSEPSAPVASVVVTPSAVSQNAGATQQLAARLMDSSGNVLTGRTVVWTSNAPAVAIVNASGLETAVGAGTATMTATIEGKSGTATVTVTAVTTNPGTVTNLAVAGTTSNSITLSFTEVNDGSGQPASYDIRWAIGTISWWSATSVAQGTCQVPVTGTAIGATRSCTVLGLTPSTSYLFQLVAFRGTRNLNAVYGALSNVVTGTTAAAALAPVASVSVSPAGATVTLGATQQFVATLKDASGTTLSGRTVTWASSSPTIAAVNANGLVTGVAAGTATITATSEGKSAMATATVTATTTGPGTVTNLTVVAVSSSSATLSFTEVNGGTGQPASYDIRWAIGTISWWSATSVAQGTCQVPVAGTMIGATRNCTVLGLTPSTSYQFQLVAFRGTRNLNAVYGPLSNVVTGTTAAAALASVASVSLSPASANVIAKQTVQLTATSRDANGNALTGRLVTWASSNTGVATVNGSGFVTSIAVGVAIITAASEGQSGTAAITVVVTPPGGNYPNQPAGFNRIMEHDFTNALSTTKWTATGLAGAWRDEGGASYVNDVNAPQSPQRGIRTTFGSGLSAGNAPTNWGGWDTGEAGTDQSRIYYSAWIMIEGTDYENQAVGTKMGFFGYADPGSSANNQGFPILVGAGSQRIGSAWNLGFWQQGHVSRELYQNVNTSPIMTVGSWHHWEMLLTLNTLGSANGTFKWWVDGTLIMNYTNVTYITSGYTHGFHAYKWNPTWGGMGGTKTRTDFMRTDHVYISGVR